MQQCDAQLDRSKQLRSELEQLPEPGWWPIQAPPELVTQGGVIPMLKQIRYLGIDVSKEKLVVAFRGHCRQFANSKEGHRALIAWIIKESAKLQADVQVVCEATGSYHLALSLALQAEKIGVTISNPAQIRYFGRSEGVLAKNDPIDAALIERFANARRPAADPPLCREQMALRELVNHRRQLL